MTRELERESMRMTSQPDTEAGREWIADQWGGNPNKWMTFETMQRKVDRIRAVEAAERVATVERIRAAMLAKIEWHRSAAPRYAYLHEPEITAILDDEAAR